MRDPGQALQLERLGELTRDFFDSQAVEALEKLVASAIGAPARHQSMELIEPPKGALDRYVKIRRFHSLHDLMVEGEVSPKWRDAVEGGFIRIFVKTGGPAEVAPIELSLAAMNPQFFVAPRVLGAFQGPGGSATAWEFLNGERKAFDKIGFAAQIHLVHAVAELNASPIARRGLSMAAPPRPLSWLAERLSSKPSDQRAEWARELETLQALERALPLLRRLPELGAMFVSHNDINASNVFFGDQIAIIDWEGARLAPVGADLGFLRGLDREDVLYDVYVSAMAAYGHQLNVEEVWRNAAVARVLRLVYGGWARTNLAKFKSGVAMLQGLERGR